MSILSEIAQEEHEMEMTPMIDVTFLLLVFFLLTLRFKTLEGKLASYLPKDVGLDSARTDRAEEVAVVLRVKEAGDERDPRDASRPWSGTGRFEWAPGSRVIEYAVGPHRTTDIERLRSRLEAIFASDATRRATLDARPGIVYGDVVAVLDALVGVGFTDVTFVGERAGGR